LAREARHDAEKVRRNVRVRGVVQGVGFRPFVYRLAQEETLSGFIGNDTDGVFIEIEGSPVRVDSFIARLRSEAPPLSRIDSVSVHEIDTSGDSSFRIIASEVLGRVSTGIPADAATCPDCLRELLSPADRRYRYPFLNCTNCGPRFTITRRIPYDRPQTSMAQFKMCAACQAEYDDPMNRRFHAQPNACWDCGPQLTLTNSYGDIIPGDDIVDETITRLAAGQILAIKGIGGFHLSVDATNDEAVMRLRQRKHRYGKPLAVMVRNLDAARAICEISDEEASLLTTPMRPIVLLRRRPESKIAIADSVAPGIPWLGVFLPYAPLHHLLFADGRLRALVMTSANLSEEPIAIDNDEARARLADIADAFVMHNREILQRCDDSVTALVDGAPQIIRRARGYVPLGIELPFETPPLLAVGGHLKNVFALASGRHIYQSQHLGDLENITGLEFFRESLDHLMRTFEIEPEAVVHDLHPGYLSTRWATEWAAERGLRTIAVQHHFAHVAGCVAEHGIDSDFIGLSLDGTGYGTDGRIWGGEVLIGYLSGERAGSFERFAHLDYVPMPGGEAAIREPWRMALGHLSAAGFEVESPEILARLGASSKETQVISRMIERGINTPLTSSCGRLFDAVAALVLRRTHVDYEAQAAIELEGLAVDEPCEIGEAYPFEIHPGDFARSIPATIATAKLWEAILSDLRVGVAQTRIAARFHASVTSAFIRTAVDAGAATGIRQVAISGGCMHNRRLAVLIRRGLEAEGLRVMQHRQVSPGDGGLTPPPRRDSSRIEIARRTCISRSVLFFLRPSLHAGVAPQNEKFENRIAPLIPAPLDVSRNSQYGNNRCRTCANSRYCDPFAS
jgi:hydrogenase maturation protein HypF